MMTAHATIESALEAMKLGALDYLQKPFEIDELLVVVDRALDHQRLRTEYRYLRSERDEQFDHYGIIGRSRAMQEIIRRAERVADTKSTVLITGETGTGKELVARAIHDRSAAAGHAAHQGELRGDSRIAARIGAVRPRPRRVHRRDDHQEGQVRAGRRRHDLPRRNRHDEPDAAVEAAARPAGARVRAARRRAHRKGRRPGHCRHQPRPAADGRGRASSRRISSTGSTSSRSSCRRCANAATTSRRWSSTSSASTRSAPAGRSSGSRTACWRRCSSTTGRATSVSWRTPSSARSCCRRARSSRRGRSQWSAPPRRRRPACPPSSCGRTSSGWSSETIRRALESARGVKKDAAELMGISQRALSYYLAKYRID